MPMYHYRCEKCEKEATEITTSASQPVPEPKCCEQVMARQYGQRRANLTGVFHKPIEMHSIGLAHADEIAAFQARNPRAEISTDPSHPLYGVPIARTRQEKLSILRREGCVEKN